MKSENGGPSRGVRGSLRLVRATPEDPRPKIVKEAMRRLGLKAHDVRLVIDLFDEMYEYYESDAEIVEAIFDLED